MNYPKNAEISQITIKPNNSLAQNTSSQFYKKAPRPLLYNIQGGEQDNNNFNNNSCVISDDDD
jgi:hypothetical protein